MPIITKGINSTESLLLLSYSISSYNPGSAMNSSFLLFTLIKSKIDFYVYLSSVLFLFLLSWIQSFNSFSVKCFQLNQFSFRIKILSQIMVIRTRQGMQSSLEECQLVLVWEEKMVKDGRESIGSQFIINGEWLGFESLSFKYL